MTQAKPGLVIFASIYLFFYVGILVFTAVIPFSFLAMSGRLPPATLVIVLVAIVMSALFVTVGVGLLKGQNWARIGAIILFSLLIFSGVSRLISPQPLGPRTTLAFRQGQRFGQLLLLGLSGLGLYGMAFNQVVKSFFKRDQ